MDTVKGLFGYVVLGVCVVLAYQGYQNTSDPDATEPLAKSVACQVDSQCVLKGERPREIRSDVFGRYYDWKTTVGPVEVTCRRELLFFGEWACTSAKPEPASL